MIDPRELRHATWAEVQQHVTDDMLRVHQAWRLHGPGTTRQVAERSGISLLTLRPRTTDLGGLGLVACIGRSGNEGIYAHVEEAAAEQAWTEGQRPPAKPEGAADVLTLTRQINTLPVKDQISIAASIMARAAHQRRQPVAANQGELSLA